MLIILNQMEEFNSMQRVKIQKLWINHGIMEVNIICEILFCLHEGFCMVCFIWIVKAQLINSFLASGNFCRLPITVANSLDPDQDRQNVKLFDTLIVFLDKFFENVNFEKISRRQKGKQNYPVGKEFKVFVDSCTKFSLFFRKIILYRQNGKLPSSRITNVLMKNWERFMLQLITEYSGF